MSNSVTGVVDNSFTKTKKTKVGDKIINYISVDGLEVSTGFKKVFEAGEHVAIGVKFNFGEWQYDAALSNAAPAATKKEAIPARSGGKTYGGTYANKKFPVEPTDGQMSIIRQNSMNRAVEILKQWSEFGIWETDSETEYLKKLIEVALTITDFNSGQDITKLKAAAAANIAAVGE